jgi:ferredoxin
MAARMGLLLQRMPTAQFASAEWQDNMSRIRECQHCGHCVENCPYGLEPPALLEKSLAEYESWLTASH